MKTPFRQNWTLSAIFMFSAEILEFGHSCAEMSFRQKFRKRIPQVWYNGVHCYSAQPREKHWKTTFFDIIDPRWSTWHIGRIPNLRERFLRELLSALRPGFACFLGPKRGHRTQFCLQLKQQRSTSTHVQEKPETCLFFFFPMCSVDSIWLVVSTPLKNISQLGSLFQILGGKKCSKPPTSHVFFMIVLGKAT